MGWISRISKWNWCSEDKLGGNFASSKGGSSHCSCSLLQEQLEKMKKIHKIPLWRPWNATQAAKTWRDKIFKKRKKKNKTKQKMKWHGTRSLRKGKKKQTNQKWSGIWTGFLPQGTCKNLNCGWEAEKLSKASYSFMGHQEQNWCLESWWPRLPRWH